MYARIVVGVFGIVVGVLACAETVPEDCVWDDCNRSCAPVGGSCVSGTCRCATPDVGPETAPCENATCVADCIGRGYSSGLCVGTVCQCAGMPSDAETLDVADVFDDAVSDDTAPEDAGPEDAGPEDVASAAVGDPCSVPDLVEQELCGPGMKCVFTELSGTTPVPVCDRDGRRALDESCSGYSISDTCQAGMMCLNSGGAASCRRLCRLDGDCSDLGVGAGCAIRISVSGTTADGIASCTHGCDIMSSSGCATGLACRPVFPDTGGSYTDCTPAGTGTQNSDCTGSADAGCARGYSCFIVGGTDTICLKLCRVSYGASDCYAAGGTTCSALPDDPAGQWGACL